MTTDPRTIAVWAETLDPDNNIIMGNSASPDGLPWPRQREDLIHFREATRDRVLVMGRKTFEKLPDHMKTPAATAGRPLVILTHDISRVSIDPAGWWWCGRADTAADVVATARLFFPAKRGLAVIGGPEVIEFMEPELDRLIVTSIHGHHTGDVRAPSSAFLQQFGPEKITGKAGRHNISQYDREVPNTEEEDTAA